MATKKREYKNKMVIDLSYQVTKLPNQFFADT